MLCSLDVRRHARDPGPAGPGRQRHALLVALRAPAPQRRTQRTPGKARGRKHSPPHLPSSLPFHSLRASPKPWANPPSPPSHSRATAGGPSPRSRSSAGRTGSTAPSWPSSSCPHKTPTEAGSRTGRTMSRTCGILCLGWRVSAARVAGEWDGRAQWRRRSGQPAGREGLAKCERVLTSFPA